MLVYLLHFKRKMGHAQHYLGKTTDLRQRMSDHRGGQGARILAECNRRGIRYEVVRTWKRADRGLERRLKSLHRADLCPRCSGSAAMRRGHR